jgi:class 3 adenylate cyclase
MPGMEVQANATHTLLTQRFLRPVGTPTLLLLMGVLALLTTFTARRSPPAQALLGAAGLTAMVLLLAHLALRMDRWLYATLPILTLGLSFGLTLLLEQRAVRTLLPPWLWGRSLVTEEGTALVTDVRSSVGIGVRIGSEWKFRALNAYFAQAEKIIADHGGDLVDYAGDASVFWFRRAKSEEASHAQRALSAARKLVENLGHFQVEWPAESRELFDFGIGIDTGQATIGLAGGRLRKQPSIVGTCVDVAARLESMTKEYHCRLLVSENTYQHAPDVLVGELLGALPVRGLPEPLKVYRVWPRDGAVIRDT